MRIRFSVDQGDMDKAFRRLSDPIGRAATKAMDDTKDQVVREGRAQIGSALGRRFANAWRGTRYPQQGNSMEPAAWFYHRIPYAEIFQTGGTIHGKPMLWLPLPNVPKMVGGRRMTPKAYIANVGPLHSIERPGKPPMLAGYMRGLVGSKPTVPKLRAGSALARLGVRSRYSSTGRAGLVSVPLFIGIPTVEMNKRFDIAPVIQQAAQQLPAKFYANLGTR